MTTSMPPLERPWPGIGCLLLLVLICAGGLFGTARPLAAQNPDLLGVLGKFVGGFKGASAYYAPVGALRSDALEERGELQEIGIFFRNPKLDLLVGVDFLSGFTASEGSLDLNGSVVALPSITRTFGQGLFDAGGVFTSANLGVTVGLSQLQDARARIPQSTGADRAVHLAGGGFHAGVTVGLSFGLGPGGVYIDNSFRYNRFPGLDWREADKSIAPPAGWPTSMDFWTSTLRIGFGFATPES